MIWGVGFRDYKQMQSCDLGRGCGVLCVCDFWFRSTGARETDGRGWGLVGVFIVFFSFSKL